MERRAPGQSHVLDGFHVRGHAHHGDIDTKQRGLHRVAVQAAPGGKTAGHVPVHCTAGGVSAVPLAGGELDHRPGRGHCRGLLQLQLPDYPGGAQHQDAGHRLHALGPRRAGVHVSFQRLENPPGRHPFRPCAFPANQGQPPANHLLPGHHGAAVRRGGAGAHHPHQGLEAVLAGISPAAGAGRRGYRHQRE